MLLGQKPHTAGNATRFVIDYSDWLLEGESLAAPATVVMDPLTATVNDVTIGAVAITPSNHLVFLLSGGSVNETFTLDVQVHTSRGEVKNDTLAFTVIKP